MRASRIAIVAGTAAAGIVLSAVLGRARSVYRDDPSERNPLEGKRVAFAHDEDDPENADGVRGHLEVVGESQWDASAYDRIAKRALDVALSLGGLVVLGPALLGIGAAIYVDDPGPVLFTQKRVGRGKRYFRLHKFRSMRMDTPRDVPTHMLEDPNRHITRVGRFIRLHSLDELPQVWDILVGNMSVVGPRPGLWNQDLLTSERDKYGANDVRPGLTGLAQISGRDELGIPEKARLDGEYAEALREGGLRAFLMDCRCFLGTVLYAARGEGVVEGGTGTMPSSKTGTV